MIQLYEITTKIDLALSEININIETWQSDKVKDGYVENIIRNGALFEHRILDQVYIDTHLSWKYGVIVSVMTTNFDLIDTHIKAVEKARKEYLISQTNLPIKVGEIYNHDNK